MAAAILAAMVLLLRMVMLPLPRELHPHNQQVASNPARNPDEPAQGRAGSFLFNEFTCFHQ
jgi:hypothetical protein